MGDRLLELYKAAGVRNTPTRLVAGVIGGAMVGAFLSSGLIALIGGLTAPVLLEAAAHSYKHAPMSDVK